MTLAKIPRADLATLLPLAQRAQQLVDAEPLSKNTRDGYAGDWQAFEAWCVGAGLESFPPSEVTLRVYLTHLLEENLKLSSLLRAQAGIVHGWKTKGDDWIAPPDLRRFWKNVRLKLGKSKNKKDAITDGMLKQMVLASPPDLFGIRNRALLTTGWIGVLRRSEIVGLDADDCVFVPEGMIITLRESKTDQQGEGFEKGIPFADDERFCATRLMKAWFLASGIRSGPVFRSIEVGQRVANERLTGGSVARIVKRCARDAGLDDAPLAGHSLRAGFLTTAALKGKSLDSSMRQSGHLSERVARGYIRHGTLFTDNAAKGLL